MRPTDLVRRRTSNGQRGKTVTTVKRDLCVRAVCHSYVLTIVRPERAEDGSTGRVRMRVRECLLMIINSEPTAVDFDARARPRGGADSVVATGA